MVEAAEGESAVDLIKVEQKRKAPKSTRKVIRLTYEKRTRKVYSFITRLIGCHKDSRVGCRRRKSSGGT